MIQPKSNKGRVPVSTHLTPEQYDRLNHLVAGKTSISDAVRQILLKFLQENTDK